MMNEFFQQTFDFKYACGGTTPLKLPHSTGWRIIPYTICICPIRAKVKIEFSNDTCYFAGDNEVIVIGQEVKHRITVHSGIEPLSCWCQFQFSILHNINIFDFYNVPVLIHGKSRFTIEKLCHQIDELPQKESLLEKMFFQKCYGMELAKEIIENSEIKENAEKELKSLTRITPALKYMQKHLNSRVYLEQIAQAANLSVSRFSSIFFKATGMSPVKYFENLRLMKAKSLLITSDISIGEIAEQLGYYDAYHFSKQFKKGCGLSPSVYRTQGERLF